MEVAASLPNILKVFPLGIIAKERFPISQEEAIPTGHGEAAAASNADSEMEEGEIDPRESLFSSSRKEVLGILESAVAPLGAQHSWTSLDCNENIMISTSVQHVPHRPSLMDDRQLKQSVDALLLLPDKLSQQVQSRSHGWQVSYPCQSAGHCQASATAKKEKGSSILKSPQRSSPVSLSKVCSTPPMVSQSVTAKEALPLHQTQVSSSPQKMSAPQMQSSALKQSAVPSLHVFSPSKQPETPFLVNEPSCSPPLQSPDRSSNSSGLNVFSPLTQKMQERQACSLNLLHPCPHEHVSKKPTSTNVDSQVPVPSALPTVSLEGEPLLNLPQIELVFKEFQVFSQVDIVASTLASSEGPSFSKQPGVDCTTVGELGQVSSLAREPFIQTFLTQSDHHQSSVNPPYALGSSLESQPLISLESNTSQPSVHASASSGSSWIDDKAFISHINGKRRPRTSATRDYPEGCGRTLCATTNQGLVEHVIPSFPHGKLPLTMTAANDRPLSGPSFISKAENGHRKQNLIHPLQGQCRVGDTSGYLQCSQSRLENQTALCLNKSSNVSVLPLKRQSVQGSLPAGNFENRTITATSGGTLPKKLRVQPLSCILSSSMESPSPPPLEERSSQSQWFLEDELFGHGHSIKAARPIKLHARPRLPKPLRKVICSVSQNLKGLENVLPLYTDCGASSRFQVKRTLQEFDCVRRSLAMGAKEQHSRPDLAAAKILKNKGRWRNCEEEKIVGHVPGVEVGDQFSFRIEMLIVGLHRQVQGGIDYISANVRPKGPLATSIVASGGYEDDNDYGDTFIYTGQGGNNYKTDRRQGKDQVLKRGNLALSNSFKERTPVRVIRGSTDEKFYTYDGLYDVIDCWFQIGVAGFGVYQYKLSRRPGQPKLASSIVRFMGIVKKSGLARPHLLLGDLSHGKERLPVSVVNEVDGEGAPEFFTYIPKMKYPSWYNLDLSRGCDCVGGCVDASKCLCAAKNGGEFPYNEIGQIVIHRNVVFECGKSCACPSSCYNRVSQKGFKHQLEVFKTRKSGWGVRSLEPIRPGDFICEYVGELLLADAEQRTGCGEYLFDIGHRSNTWMDVSDLLDVRKGEAIVPVVEDEGFTIDARLFGSVARFVNHSCSPNLYVQDVVYDSDDLRFPHVMLFAMENVPPMRELSYDYNYSIGHVRDANGDVKSKPCYCGAQDCRGRL